MAKGKETVATRLAPAAIGPYSQAVKANGFVFVSGQLPTDPETGQIVSGDVKAQTKQVLENLKTILPVGGQIFVLDKSSDTLSVFYPSNPYSFAVQISPKIQTLDSF